MVRHQPDVGILVGMSLYRAAELLEDADGHQVRSCPRAQKAVNLDASRHRFVDKRGQRGYPDPPADDRDALGIGRQRETAPERTDKITTAALRHRRHHQASALAEKLVGDLQAPP